MSGIKKARLKWTNVLRILLLVFCGTVFGVNIYSFNAHTLVGNRMPMPFGWGAAVVLSGSMEPNFSRGDLIVVRSGEDFAVHDIVVYQSGDSLIVHRIIRIDGERITTKGDANNIADDPIDRLDVKGRVVFRIPFAGKIVNFLKTPLGIFLVIAAAIALFEIPERKKRRRDDLKRQALLHEIERLKQKEEREENEVE